MRSRWLVAAAAAMLGAAALGCGDSTSQPVQCRINSDCTGPLAGLVCSPDNRCVSCETHAQCGDPPNRCGDVGPGDMRRCEVGCASNSDCADPTPRCDPETRLCVGACTTDADCATPRPICESGACHGCGAGDLGGDPWCAANRPPTPLCGSDGACIATECTVDPWNVTRCPDDRQECSDDGRCISCASYATPDLYCTTRYGDERPLCNSTTGGCVARECTPGADPDTCTRPGFGACDLIGRCVPCETRGGDTYCAGIRDGATPNCRAGICTGADCTVGGHAACEPGQYCNNAGGLNSCARGCAPEVTDGGPGSCAFDCGGAGVPQACRLDHSCLCMSAFNPGMAAAADSDGCLASSDSFCLTDDGTEGTVPPAGGAASASFRFTTTLVQ